MLILTLRTDKPESEIGLFDDQVQIAYEVWQAHRRLAETIHYKIAAILDANKKTWADVQGIVAYQGPGSFTGLRIGLSVANALASSNNIMIAAATDEQWIKTGIAELLAGNGSTVALPEYGAPVHITKQKK